MTTFEIVALVGAIAGLSMVLGGIWLVAKGVITMAATPEAEALAIEWRKFRLTTQVSGIAFFLVGLLFIAVSLYYLKPPPIVPIEVAGTLEGVNVPASVSIRPKNDWSISGDSQGKIEGQVNPNLKFLLLVIRAPGYDSEIKSVQVLGENRRVANFGTIKLHRVIEEKELNERNLKEKVKDLPFPSPALNTAESSGFGAAR